MLPEAIPVCHEHIDEAQRLRPLQGHQRRATAPSRQQGMVRRREPLRETRRRWECSSLPAALHATHTVACRSQRPHRVTTRTAHAAGLTVDCADCRCFLSVVFLGGARRLDLSPWCYTMWCYTIFLRVTRSRETLESAATLHAVMQDHRR